MVYIIIIIIIETFLCFFGIMILFIVRVAVHINGGCNYDVDNDDNCDTVKVMRMHINSKEQPSTYWKPRTRRTFKILSAKAQNAQEWWGRRNLWLKVMESCSHQINLTPAKKRNIFILLPKPLIHTNVEPF